MKAVWKRPANSQALENWDNPITVSSAPNVLIFGRTDPNEVMSFTIDLHRLTDGRHVGNIEVITSTHQWLKGTILLPASVTAFVFGSYQGEVGNIEITGLGFP